MLIVLNKTSYSLQQLSICALGIDQCCSAEPQRAIYLHDSTRNHLKNKEKKKVLPYHMIKLKGHSYFSGISRTTAE